MKVLFTQDALINAGTERSNLELLSRFSSGIETFLVYFYPRHELKDEYERVGIRLLFLDIREKYHLISGARRLVKLIREEKPDLLVSSLWRADIMTRFASWITGVPLVGTLVNDSYSEMAWKDKSGLKHRIVYWMDRITAGIPKFWIANAKALVDSHLKTLGLDPNKISVVYRGREIPVLKSGVERPIRDFISYGRLLERKGFQDAILAFGDVIKSYPECTLTIYGEGPYRKELETLILDLGLENSVTLPGKVSEPHCLLPTADCFLFPSWYEGFSGALVEAMMAGIPIIASDISMNLEAVEDGRTALIFPVKNCEKLSELMIIAIEDPVKMKELGHFARSEAIEKFDIQKIAYQYEETLKRIYSDLKKERG
ncbi:glycosyltransferase [Algoriphagus mannitolivorans]|uniref:glycosyltransferase n=1 Tax=Algoriphagus mannitolivorans TaxID=226504 RepID=UPI00041FC39F|nr:glycosyltransferase [Algoriphagus mannitolivorans]